jgi:hypothetical protein
MYINYHWLIEEDMIPLEELFLVLSKIKTTRGNFELLLNGTGRESGGNYVSVVVKITLPTVPPILPVAISLKKYKLHC